MKLAAPAAPGTLRCNLPGEDTGSMRPWVILAALTLGRVAVGYQLQTVAALGTTLVPLFHLTYAEFGALIGAYMLLGVFVALPFGILGRWLGDRLLTTVGFALMVVGPIVCVWSNSAGSIAAGRVVAGVGGVGMIVLQGKIIADWFPGRRFMMAISIAVCGYPIGVDLAQLILPPVSHAFGWPTGFVSGCVVPTVALVLFVGGFRRSPHVEETPPHFALPSLHECLLLVIAGVMWTAYTAGFTGYLSYVPSTLAWRGATVTLTGLVVTIATWGNIPATLFGGGLAERFGGSSVLVVGTLGLAIGAAGTALFHMPVVGAVLVGVIGSIHPGVIVALGTLSARQEHRAVGMGIFYSLYYAGNTIGPALCGQTADLYGGPAGGLLAAAVIALLAIPMYLLHQRLARREVLPTVVAGK